MRLLVFGRLAALHLGMLARRLAMAGRLVRRLLDVRLVSRGVVLTLVAFALVILVLGLVILLLALAVLVAVVVLVADLPVVQVGKLAGVLADLVEAVRVGVEAAVVARQLGEAVHAVRIPFEEAVAEMPSILAPPVVERAVVRVGVAGPQPLADHVVGQRRV